MSILWSSSAASTFAVAGTAAGASLGATAAAAGTFGLKMNANMETASIAFETMHSWATPRCGMLYGGWSLIGTGPEYG